MPKAGLRDTIKTEFPTDSSESLVQGNASNAGMNWDNNVFPGSSQKTFFVALVATTEECQGDGGGLDTMMAVGGQWER